MKEQESELDSFAKAAPVYDDFPRTKKDAKTSPQKGKDKKRKKSDAIISPAQPPPTAGPVAPGLRMRQNVAMALDLALIAPLPPMTGRLFYAKLTNLYNYLDVFVVSIVGYQ